MKYTNTEYVTSFYVEFEPVKRTIINSFRENFFLWLDSEGLDITEFRVGFLIDDKTEDLFGYDFSNYPVRPKGHPGL